MSVTAIIPTVDGREESLERTLKACADENVNRVQVIRNRETCGEAWVEGARKARTKYVAFLADDLDPHTGCFQAMIGAVEAKRHPAALVLEPDGSKQSCGGAGGDVCRGDCHDWQPVEWSPTPFIRRDWWPLIEEHADMLANLHYSSDCLISAILAKHGIPSVMRRPAVLTHYNHQAGRVGRAGSDGAMFHAYRTEHGL